MLLQENLRPRPRKMLLPNRTKQMHTRRRSEHMNIQNRRLKDIQKEKIFFKKLLDQSTKQTDKQIYTGKLEILENEETQILKKQGVTL